MPRLVALALAFILAPAALAQSPVGDWSGALDLTPYGQDSLRLVFHVQAEADGYAATLDVPAQGAFGIPATSTTLSGDTLSVVIDAIQARLDVAVGADSLRGTFTQNIVFPLVLGPAEPIRRPQTPQPPFPYRQEEVEVASAEDVTLAGTLTLPEGEGPFPAVLFVSGSGAQDRDETLFEHKPFAVLADALARAGVASLRYDDRGTAASTGDFASADLDDFTADARAALAALAARSEVSTVGVLGHSEGGYIAPRLAPEADFVVMLAGPAVSGAEVYALQHERLVRAAGIDSAAAAGYGRAIAALLAPLLARPDAPADSLRPRMAEAFNAALVDVPTAARMGLGLSGPAYPQVRDQLLDFVLAPSMRAFLLYDPAPALAALDVPTLALYGGKDLQVPADQSADVATEALAGDVGSAVIVIPDANHLFQTAETGGVGEYGQIEETMAPETIQRIVEWVLQTVHLE